jgi:leader peptidase (prepilin peptidase)/N-methyltransferase
MVLEWLLAIWLLCIGGCVGSFLNVVIYRLPAGKSIVHPGSHCPRCNHPIRWYDNIPVLSWLLLRARCRDCGASISARYPLVEMSVAALFVALAVVEVFSGAPDMPWGIYAYHLLLICTLVCVVLVEADAKRVPGKLVLPAALAGLVAPLFFPGLRPVPLLPALPLAPLWEGLTGMVVGLLLAALTRPAAGHGRPFYATGLCGLFLGWQAAAVVAAATAVLYLAATILWRLWASTGSISWPAIFLVTTFAWLLAWKPLVEWQPAVGHQAGLATLAIAGLTIALCSLLTHTGRYIKV